MNRIIVTCAIIEVDNKILVVQRSEKMKLPLKWEFPGGKLEPNETEEDCIKREIKEEINIEIDIIKRLSPTNFDYPNVSIQLIPFVTRYTKGGFKLKEHKEYLIIEKKELNKLDWAEADIPVLNEYLNL
jgi:8-oxo-dGTP diphosphatase